MVVMSSKEFVKDIIARDRETFLEDLQMRHQFKEPEADVESSSEADVNLIADFTEYNPLHNGHLHCLLEAKKAVPHGIFVAVVPGLFERSGRGLPYIMTRQARAETAIAMGADIVVEGPPMGIMGSGQYSLCLARMFQALDADHIPRGYKPMPGFDLILQKINQGVGVAPKPYRMVDMETGRLVMEGRLHEDNYVIASLSKSLTKIGFKFQGKFIFVPRLEGVSGTIIRKAVISGDLESADEMLPPETIKILRREMGRERAPLNEVRDVNGILSTANQATAHHLKSFSLLDEKTTECILKKRPFKFVSEIKGCIARGFSRNHPQRVLSSLEARIDKDSLSKYIENYPSVIRILNYKNKEVLREFKKRIPNRRQETCQ
jgi:predicted nucleotidyltransferase